MKNSLISTGIAVLMASGSMVSFASSVTVPNTFVTGTPAVAAEVNANFDAVAVSVNDNDSRVTTNTGTIGTNTTNIGTNTTNIGTNTGNIGTNTTNIGNNTTAITDLQNGVATCPSDMVDVGSLCVDTYEASLWSAATGGSQLTINPGAPYWTCAANGSDCGTAAGPGVAIYARSVPGVLPAQRVTWLQAVQACANVGKRLPTAAEWQMAAAGTPDGGDDGTTACRSAGGNVGPINTGVAANCTSTAGAADMVGNLWEWVADISQAGVGGYADAGAAGGLAGIAFGEAYDNDSATPNTRAAVKLDGTFVGFADAGLITTNSRNGFRCVR